MPHSVDFAWRFAGLCLAWLAGVGVQLQCRTLPPSWAVHGVLAAALVLVLFARRCGPAARWRCAMLAAAMLAFGATSWRAGDRLAEVLPADLEGEDIVVVGVVAGLPQSGTQGIRFRFDVDTATWHDRPAQVPSRLVLGWYSGFGDTAPPIGEVEGLGAGQRWRFTVRLRQPVANRNPHGFDQELSLFEQGVRATGSVRPQARRPPEWLGPAVDYPVQRLRQHVRNAIFDTVPDARAAGVLAALAVGDQSAIDRADWQVFRDTGVAHLMSISGLHVTMFAWLAGWAVRALWVRSRRASLRWPAPWAARVGGLAAASAYALFAGWGVPAQRTVWMLAVVTLLKVSGRHWPWLLVLMTAAAVVAALDPWALLQPGFWLSFVAVGLLMVSAPGVSERAGVASHGAKAWRWLGGALRAQAVAAIGLTPLSLVFFQQVSFVGFAANLVAIPVVTLVTTPLALLGIACSPLWLAGARVVQWSGDALAVASRWPGAVGIVPVAAWWAQAAGLAAAAVAVMPLPWRLRCLAVPLVLPLLLPPVARPPAGRYDVLAVDVGQGTAVFVRTRSHLLVYDTGPRYSPDATAGERVLLPLLHARGDTRIHRLVLSHRDTDHTGGADAVLSALPVDELLSSLEPGHALLGRAGTDLRCDAGQSWTWDGVTFDVLHPPGSDHPRPLKPNARSCVLRVHGPQGSLLLAGDIEREQEGRLVAAGAPLQSDVLLVPHHGSRTSSTVPFVDAVKPSVALIQAGYRNRFGHPVADVVQRYVDRGVQVRTSVSCGAWHWRGDGPATGATCERARSLRYWHRTP